MIDQKLLKRTLENRFTLQYTTKAEILKGIAIIIKLLEENNKLLKKLCEDTKVK